MVYWVSHAGHINQRQKEIDMAEQEAAVKPVVIRPDLNKYVTGVSGAGKKTKRADNPVSEALDGFTVEETAAVAAKMTGIPAKELLARYAGRNIGMQKMNLANRIRGAVAKLDKAHEADKAVVPGLKTLAFEARASQDAVAARRKTKAQEAEQKAAKAAEAAKAKEAKAKAPKAEKAALVKGKGKAA